MCIVEENYDGFLITNLNGNSAYKQLPTVEDCQILCQALDYCLFFNFYEGSNVNECELKYGVGNRVTNKDRLRGTKQLFGPKNCPNQTTGPTTPLNSPDSGKYQAKILFIFRIHNNI